MKLKSLSKIALVVLSFAFFSSQSVACEYLGSYDQNTERPKLNCRNYAASLGYPFFKAVDKSRRVCEAPQVILGGLSSGGGCRQIVDIECYGCF